MTLLHVAGEQTEQQLSVPHWERPCAAKGLISYRCKGRYGWIMIGATSDSDALSEAYRSTDQPHDLQVWNGAQYTAI